MRLTRVQGCVPVLVLAALVWSAAAAAGPYDRPSPPRSAPAAEQAETPPEDPQDPVHQCRLGCADSCKTFANAGLREQCLASCYSKCTATYER